MNELLTVLGFVVIIALLCALEFSIQSDQRQRVREGVGGCEVCGRMDVPICLECCRCKDKQCNGGCIMCRRDFPFGRVLR